MCKGNRGNELFLWLAIVTGALAAAALASGTNENEPPELLAVKTAQPPVLDGKLDDVCWKDAAAVDLSLLSGKLPSEPTKVFVTYDDYKLYIGFVCQERKPATMVKERQTRDDNVYLDDCVEVFLSVNTNGSPYYQFVVNPIGAKFDSFEREVSWSDEWDARAVIGTNCWTAEIAIPFFVLKEDGQVSALRLNLNRETKQEPMEQSTWAPVKRFHEPEKFGYLRGISLAPPLQIHAIRLGSKKIGINKMELDVENTGVTPLDLAVQAQLYDSERRQSGAPAAKAKLAAGQRDTIDLNYNLIREGNNAIQLSVLDNDAGRIIYADRYEFDIPKVFAFQMNGYDFYNDEILWVEADISVSNETGKNLALTMEITGKDNRRVGEKKILNPGDNIQFYHDIRGLPLGEYSCRLELTDTKTGQVMSSGKNTFRIIKGVRE